QYENFCRTTLGLMVSGEREHDVKSINELFIDRKDQSSLNRFITEPKWNIDEVVKEGKALRLGEVGELNESVEYKVIDDTVCRKYSSRTEMVCYNYSSTLGTVLSHDYVTSLYINDDLSLPDGLKLYGSEKKCREKGIKFKTKVWLACEMIDEHVPRARRTICLWDSWYTCYDTVARCRAHGYNWIGEIKSNRIVFYEGRKYHLNELLDKLRLEGSFSDIVVDGEIYQASKVDVFIPKIGYASIVIDVKATTRDVHLLCTDLIDCSLEEIVQHALQRHKIENFHKDAKFLGLGEYRFRESEAALIHAHLVSLTYTLLDTLRKRLLRYSIVKNLLSIEATVEWVRKKTAYLLIHKVRDATLPTRSILRMIDTN
ncbi:hypothetical protein FDZ71_07370, partial [bacterium]